MSVKIAKPLPAFLFILTSFLLMQPSQVLSQEGARGVEVERKSPQTVLKELYGNSWAVVVGINQYPKYRDLNYAISDARGVSAKLKELGFVVKTLLDQEATREKIVETLGDELGRKAKDNDRIIFYFAGHGATKEQADVEGKHMGFILPHDYDPNRHNTTAISMKQLQEISSQIKTKHMLYVMDSCFSGGIIGGRGPTPSSEGAGYQALLNLTRMRAHVVITAGTKDQTVKEEGGTGIFTQVFLDALSKQYNAPWSSYGYLTALDLASYIQKRVPDLAQNQTPQYGHLSGEGDVILALFKPLEIVPEGASSGTPVRLAPDQEERIRKMEQEREAERKEREAEKERQRIHEQQLEREKEAARREKERLEQERRVQAEQARVRDMERQAEERRLANEREAARRARERADEELRKKKPTEVESFVAPGF